MTTVVAVPVRNEAERLPALLESLFCQTGAAPFMVHLLINNSADTSAEIGHAMAAVAPMPVYVDVCGLPPQLAHAGGARARAMAQASRYAGPEGLLLSTDADCRADPDWVAAMQAALVDADLVAGRVSADWEELQRLPATALAIGANEWKYLSLVAAIEARLDPVPHDPWPRHAQRCGANFGIRAAMLNRIGGVPALPCGEDRALFARVEAADGRIRHAMQPHVTASARLDGRATGGMASTLAARARGAAMCDTLLEPAEPMLTRLHLRSAAREAWHAGRFSAWLQAVGLTVPAAMPRCYGAAWQALAECNDACRAQPLDPATIDAQIRYLETVLNAGEACHAA